MMYKTAQEDKGFTIPNAAFYVLHRSPESNRSCLLSNNANGFTYHECMFCKNFTFAGKDTVIKTYHDKNGDVLESYTCQAENENDLLQSDRLDPRARMVIKKVKISYDYMSGKMVAHLYDIRYRLVFIHRWAYDRTKDKAQFTSVEQLIARYDYFPLTKYVEFCDTVEFCQ